MPEESEDVFESSSDSKSSDSSGTTAGKSSGTESSDDGRTRENLKAEFDRKYGRLEDQISEMSEGINKLTGMLTQRQKADDTKAQQPVVPQAQTPTVSPYGAPADLSSYSVSDLQEALTSQQLTPHQREVLKQTISEKRLEQKADEIFADHAKTAQFATARTEADSAANKAFPALLDSKSEFAKRVDKVLADQRQAYGENPSDRYDVANRIAREMGVEMSKVVTPGFIAPADSGEPIKADEGPAIPSDDALAEQARKLQYAMPLRFNAKTGKMERKKFNLDRIKERSKNYADSRSIQLTPKLRG